MRRSRFALPLSLVMALLAAMVIAVRPADGRNGPAADSGMESWSYTSTFDYEDLDAKAVGVDHDQVEYDDELQYTDEDQSDTADDESADSDEDQAVYGDSDRSTGAPQDADNEDNEDDADDEDDDSDASNDDNPMAEDQAAVIGDAACPDQEYAEYAYPERDADLQLPESETFLADEVFEHGDEEQSFSEDEDSCDNDYQSYNGDPCEYSLPEEQHDYAESSSQEADEAWDDEYSDSYLYDRSEGYEGEAGYRQHDEYEEDESEEELDEDSAWDADEETGQATGCGERPEGKCPTEVRSLLGAVGSWAMRSLGGLDRVLRSIPKQVFVAEFQAWAGVAGPQRAASRGNTSPDQF